MSYTARGIAIPRVGVKARRVGVKAGGWGRGIGSYSGSLGAASAASPDMSFTLEDTDRTNANAAIAAVIAATPDRRRSPIAAVMTFQRTYGHGLTVDGIYGTNTRNALASVSGRTDLPPVGSGSSATSSGSSAIPTAIPDAAAALTPVSETPSWLLPVAAASAAILVIGGVYYMRKPVKANKRRMRRNSRRRRVRRNTGFLTAGAPVRTIWGRATVVEVHGDNVRVKLSSGDKRWVSRSTVSREK